MNLFVTYSIHSARIDKYKNYKPENINDYQTIQSLKIIINDVSSNIEAFQFNKSVAKVYEFVNILNNVVSKKRTQIILSGYFKNL